MKIWSASWLQIRMRRVVILNSEEVTNPWRFFPPLYQPTLVKNENTKNTTLPGCVVASIKWHYDWRISDGYDRAPRVQATTNKQDVLFILQRIHFLVQNSSLTLTNIINPPKRKAAKIFNEFKRWNIMIEFSLTQFMSNFTVKKIIICIPQHILIYKL